MSTELHGLVLMGLTAIVATYGDSLLDRQTVSFCILSLCLLVTRHLIANARQWLGSIRGPLRPQWGLGALLVSSAAIGELIALSVAPLSVAVLVSGASVALYHAFTHDTQDLSQRTELWLSTFMLIGGVLVLIFECRSDRELTIASLWEQVSWVRVLQHLLASSFVVVCILTWLNESRYTFSPTPSCLHMMVRRSYEPESSEVMRAKAFAILSAVAATSSILSKKCVAELLWTRTSLQFETKVAWLSTVLGAWGLLAALAAYWWQHALLCAATIREGDQLRIFLFVWMSLGFAHGALFLNEFNGRWGWLTCIGMLGVFVGFFLLPSRAPVAASSDETLPATCLVDASEALLPLEAQDEASDDVRVVVSSTSECYRPPVNFKLL